ALPLAGCGIFSRDVQPPCPGVRVLRDAERVTQYRPGKGRDILDVVYTAEIGQLGVGCRYGERRIEQIVTVGHVVERGPAAERSTLSVPFFAALVDPQERILAKQVFTREVTFEERQRRAGVAEEVELEIPISAPED